eukprot:6868763-Alexandrium_andersonii.AAC.1
MSSQREFGRGRCPRAPTSGSSPGVAWATPPVLPARTRYIRGRAPPCPFNANRSPSIRLHPVDRSWGDCSRAWVRVFISWLSHVRALGCLLYTSDAADDM